MHLGEIFVTPLKGFRRKVKTFTCMTNQLNFSPQNSTLNWTKLWLWSKIFLVCLIATTLLSSVVTLPANFYLSNIAILILFLLGLFLLKFKRKQTPFVKIENQQLQYFCVIKREIVTIPVNEIIKVTTQFCELQIHTSNRTHCLNLNHIKEENQRWEIKEMIRKLAPENGNRAVNF